MTGSGTRQDNVQVGQGGRKAPGLVQATWLLATALARRIVARLDDRLARRLEAGSRSDT